VNYNIIKNDFAKNKIITIVIFIFILLSAFFISSGSSMIINVFQSLEALFTKADAPHYVQMHTGKIDERDIEKWAKQEQTIKQHQIVEMVTINGSNLFFGKHLEAQTNSVQDISFVKQNKWFDFLLDLNNQVIHLNDGEIGVPIYFMERANLKIGDIITVDNGIEKKTYTITHFIRDALMNPPIVHSKRFLVNESDFNDLKNTVSDMEYLIEFQLHDIKHLNEFDRQYQSSHLPNQGPTIDYPMFKMLHALADGVIAAIVIFVSLFLMLISLLCLRLTILSTLEEDYHEIGTMKAIGVHQTTIRNIYLFKYVIVASIAIVFGYILSLFFNSMMTKSINLYTGLNNNTLFSYIVPLLASSLLLLIIISFCMLTLRRFNHISPIDALRASITGEISNNKKYISLNKSKYSPVNLFLSMKDIFDRKKMYSLLFVIFVISTFIIIVPTNFLNTIQSPNFINYMGIGKSDLRIDLQPSNDIEDRLQHMTTYLQNDEDIKIFSSMVTYQYKVVNNDGMLENLTVEIGDMSSFPLKYLEGNVPIRNNEIALSYLQAKDLEKNVGDTVNLIIDGNKKEITVSGIYQDITMGGKTAKAQMSPPKDRALSYVISLDVKDHVSITDKMKEYTEQFHQAKVTHIRGYLTETLGSTIKKVNTLTTTAISIGVFISLLMTFLFMKMLIAKDTSQHAILRSIGFSLWDIQVQYISKILFILITAITIGTILANVLGERIISILWSFLGAAKVEFVIYPLKTYILSPIILMAAVMIAILLSIPSVNHANIKQFNKD